MENFKDLFLRQCKEDFVEIQEQILERIRLISSPENNNPGIFDLAGLTLTIGTCNVLGKVLRHDLCFTELILADCMLHEEGVKALVSSLESNTYLQLLDLRGNNLRQTSATALGHFLRQNHTLRTLCLEWNSLGLWEAAFGTLCEGLAANAGLTSLDIRNNEINHVGAQELALALKSNTTLNCVDIRWNNIGLVGGRALQKAVERNKSLVKFDTTGNNLPQDLSNSINQSMLYNTDRMVLSESNKKKTKILSQEIGMLESERKQQMIDFTNEIELSRSQLNRSRKSSSKKIAQLQNALEERKSALNQLHAKLDMTEASLTLLQQKVQDQEKLIELGRKEAAEIVKNYEAQLFRERQDRGNSDDKMRRELAEANEKLFDKDREIAELDRKLQNQDDRIALLKENNSQLKADIVFQTNKADEHIEKDKRLHQDALQEQERLHQKLMSLVKSEAENNEKSLKDRLHVSELKCVDLQEQITSLNAKLISERNDSNQAQHDLKLSLQQENQTNQEQNNERLRAIQLEKTDLRKQIASLSTDVLDLQSTKTSLTVENEGLRRTIQNLQKQITSKDSDMMTEIGRVRSDMQQKINLLQERGDQYSSQCAKIAELETRLSEYSQRHHETIEAKKNEIERLTSDLRHAQNMIEQIREDEAQRASVLQSAVMNYIQGSPTRRLESPRKL